MSLKISGRVLFAGDWHGVLQQYYNSAKEASRVGADTIIHVGDFGIYKRHFKYLDKMSEHLVLKGIKLYFIDGNHEGFDELYSYPILEDGTRKIRENLYHLPRGCIVKWDGKNLLAMGGAHSVDKDMRQDRINWFEEELITLEDVDTGISNSNGKDIFMLISHDSPTSCPNFVIDNPLRQAEAIKFYGKHNIISADNNRKTLDIVYQAVKPPIVIHGHYHEEWLLKAPYGVVLGLNEGSVGVSRSAVDYTVTELEKLVKDFEGKE